MHRKTLLKSLEEYRKRFPEELEVISRFTSFVGSTPSCFERSHTAGHITGSAFVLSADASKVLLTHHAKLRRWFQLGGHADGCPDAHEVALREAIEESGIAELSSRATLPVPIDLDIHEIPASAKEGAHLHYDVRYIFYSSSVDFVCSNESLELKWISLGEIASYSSEPSILRVINKIL